ncbi:MAG: hypothetical protein UW16_C0017G0001, partial [Microgenomates group bacterium GW2011_GWC1_44_10]
MRANKATYGLGADMINSVVAGFAEAYGTNEGWENAVIGGLTGLVGSPMIMPKTRRSGKEGYGL